MQSTDVPIVSDILLGSVKDRRYIDHLSNLLTEVVSPYYCVATSSPINDGANKAATSCLQPEIYLLARLLHSLIIVKEGTSLGLDHLGLGYSQYVLRTRLFAVLYTISPYMLERAKRNGWNDIRNVRSSLSLILGSGGNSTMGREHLRGESRRRIHEEMRQRMLERTSDRMTNAHTASIQHQQTILNGNNSHSQPAPHPATTESHSEDHIGRSRTWKDSVMNAQILLQSMLRHMSIASQSRSPIPHELTGSTSSNDNHGASTSVSARMDRLAGLYKWLIRLNLALFYVNGKYPSIIHRMCGLQVQQQTSSKVKIIAERPAYNIIGLMILAQGGAKLVQSVVDLTIDAWYSRKKKIEDARSEPQSIAGNIEAKVPSIDSFRKIGERNGTPSLSESFNTINCGICMNERKCPAIPIACGHVFCWKCIQHWIATVRHECPLCRSPTRPQDVIILRNYAPS
jgi:hypothetical protein